MNSGHALPHNYGSHVNIERTSTPTDEVGATDSDGYILLPVAELAPS